MNYILIKALESRARSLGTSHTHEMDANLMNKAVKALKLAEVDLNKYKGALRGAVKGLKEHGIDLMPHSWALRELLDPENDGG